MEKNNEVVLKTFIILLVGIIILIEGREAELFKSIKLDIEDIRKEIKQEERNCKYIDINPLNNLTPLEEFRLIHNISKIKEVSSKIKTYRSVAIFNNAEVYKFLEYNNKTNLIELYLVFSNDEKIYGGKVKVYEFKN